MALKRDGAFNLAHPPIIACIDDDEPVCEALEGLLVAFGYTPEIYHSAEEFITRARPDDIACLIVDVELGGMTGIELLGHLVALGIAIPTIVITAFGDARLEKKALDGGAVAFLRKPIAGTELLARIASALRERPDGSGN